MIDTHCHLNFKAFHPEGVSRVDEVIKRAKKAGVNCFVVPGTDVETSKRAIELAEKFPEIWAAVGIHPHHVFQVQSSKLKIQNYSSKLKNDKKRVLLEDSVPPVLATSDRLEKSLCAVGIPPSSTTRFLEEIEKLLEHPKVVAIGEIGLDKHYYQKTKYENYQINPEFVQAQKQLFIAQIKLAVKYKKSLIIHSREAVGETLAILGESSILDPLAGHIVFHCCEADDRLLEFALAHHIYIGVDGDVTYSKSKPFGTAQGKQEFVKKIPLELLVLETDSPFLTPQRLKPPNEPKNLLLIAEKIVEIKKTSINQLIKVTDDNSKKLFQIS